MLGAALGQYPDELRADLQRNFGLNLDRMGVDYSCAHAAACLVNMLGPSSIAIAARRDGGPDPMRGMTAGRMEELARDLDVRR